MADKRIVEAEQAVVPTTWLERVVRESKEVGTTEARQNDEDHLKLLFESEGWKIVVRFLDNKIIGLERSLSDSTVTPGITAEEIGMRYLISDQVKDFTKKLKNYVERPAKSEIIKRATKSASE